VHSHGLWMSPHRYARLAAHAKGARLVISPRGMLQDWSRNYHAIRKKLAWALFEKENMQTAHGFHATSESEALTLRRLGFKQPVAVIPNGIHAPQPVAAETIQHIRED